jgi:hypothetical protein
MVLACELCGIVYRLGINWQFSPEEKSSLAIAPEARLARKILANFF